MAQNGLSTTASATPSVIATPSVTATPSPIPAAPSPAASPVKNEQQRELLIKVAARRFPSYNSATPQIQLAYQWYVLIDHFETFREMREGNNQFYMDMKAKGKLELLPGLKWIPEIPESELTDSLLYSFQIENNLGQLGQGYVAGYLSHAAHISGRRTTGQGAQKISGLQKFRSDIPKHFNLLDSSSKLPAPPLVEQFANERYFKRTGIILTNPIERRKIAWNEIVQRTRFLQHNKYKVTPTQLARVWEMALQTVIKRWKDYPIEAEGTVESFVNRVFQRMEKDGLLHENSKVSNQELDRRINEVFKEYEDQLDMSKRTVKVAVNESYIEIINRRYEIEADPLLRTTVLNETIRRRNGLDARARLLQGLEINEIHYFSNPNRNGPWSLSVLWVDLHRHLSKTYDALFWDGEGLVDFPLLYGMVENNGTTRGKFDLSRKLVGHELQPGEEELDLDKLLGAIKTTIYKDFHLVYSISNLLAKHGWLDSWTEIVKKGIRIERAKKNKVRTNEFLTPEDQAIFSFVNLMNLRIEEKNGSIVKNPRTRAQNGLNGLSSLIIGDTNEALSIQAAKDGRRITLQQIESHILSLINNKHDFRRQGSELLSDGVKMYSAMMQESAANKSYKGKPLPFHKSGIMDSNLILRRRVLPDWPLAKFIKNFRPIWKEADLIHRKIYRPNGIRLPQAYVELINKESELELKKILAQSRGVRDPNQIPDWEVREREPYMRELKAILALAISSYDAKIKHPGKEIHPVTLANRILTYKNEGPTLYSNVPWHIRGIPESFAVNYYFHRNAWSVAPLIYLKDVNEQLAHISLADIPREIQDEIKEKIRSKTGQVPEDEAVRFQAVQDGVFICKEYSTMPMNIDPLRDPLLVTTIQEQTIPLTKDNIVKVLQLRNEVANLKLPNGQPKYPFLHLDDEGKPYYWAAIAFLHNMTIAELEQRFFVHMQAAYKEAKATFSRAELDLFKNKNKENTKIIVKAHAAKYGLDESQLVTPEIQDDDVIVETLLYHIRRVEVVVDRTNAQRDPGQPLVDKDRFIPVHLKEFFRMLKIMKDHALDGHPKSIFEEELNRQPTAVKKLEFVKKRRGKLEAQVVMLQNLKSVVYTEKRKAVAMPNLPENIKILQSLEPFLPATDSLTASASHLPTPTPSPSGAGVSATGSSGVGASASPSAVPLASISLAPAAASGGASFSAAPSLPLTPSASAGPEPFDNFIQIFLKRTDQVRKMPKFVRFIQEVESYDAYAASGLEFWLAILQTIKNIPSDKYEAVSNLLQEIKQEYLTIQHGFEPSPGNQLREAILTVADYQITNMLESLQTAEEKEDRARAKQSRIEARRREMVNQWQINDLLVDAYKLLYNLIIS